MLKCGLLGEKLGHSYSPAIHAELADYEYKLYERAPEEVEAFLFGTDCKADMCAVAGICGSCSSDADACGSCGSDISDCRSACSADWDGLNVTIPYKKTVMKYCSELSDAARKIGSVNTLVKRADGSIYGDNTDAYGFELLVRKSGISVSGKKALVLGSGGASVTVCSVLESMGARSVTVISRSGADNYENIAEKHADAQIIVNTTPVGMYPHNGVSPVDLSVFPKCEGALDIVYNPEKTAFLLQAESLGIPHAGGLYMLVAQAKRSSELFTGEKIAGSEIGRIERKLAVSMKNIVLIGMPGCGKSTIAEMLGRTLVREVCDSDVLASELAGMRIPDIFAKYGEDRFREYETEAISQLGKKSGIVIATGGGCVTRAENYPLLHQNGMIVWLKRDIGSLPKDGRPISQRSDLAELYEKRRPLYERFADFEADNNGSAEDTVNAILKMLDI